MAAKDKKIAADADDQLAATERKFNFYLVVKNPFDDHFKGQMLTEDAAIQAVIDSGNLPNCSKSIY